MKSLLVLLVLTLLCSKAVAFNSPTLTATEDVEGYDSNPRGLAFNNDGTKFYLTSFNNEEINVYDLTTAWDLTTAVHKCAKLHWTTGNVNSRHIAFNADGTYMFIVRGGAGGTDYVYRYLLSAPFDVCDGYTRGSGENSSYVLGGSNYINTNSEQTRSNGLAFSPDGKNMYITGTVGAEVNQYTLATAWDLSTAVHGGLFAFEASSGETEPMNVTFNYDGTKMWMTGWIENSIFEYDLSTAWDVRTATLFGEIAGDFVGWDDGPSTFVFTPDASKIFVLGATNDKVSEFKLYCTYGIVACKDPTSDKDDVASVEAQTESAKQLIQQTTYPVLNRMEWIRRNDNSGNLTNQNIKVQFSNPILASLSNYLIPAYLSNETSTAELKANNWSFWSEGTVSVGKIGDSITSSAKNINTSAITIGADRSVENNKMFGVALRLGNDDVDFGNVKNSLDVNAVSLTLYESRLLGEDKSIDSLIGIGAFKTDIVNAVESSSTEGTRDGKQIFGSFKILDGFKKNEPFNSNKKFKKSKKRKKNKQTDFNFVKFNLHLIQNEYPKILEMWDVEFNKVYPYEEYIKLFSKRDKKNEYPLLAFLPISTYLYADEDEGYVYVDENVESEKHTSIIGSKKIKNNLDGSFYSKIDLGFTFLSDYSEKGTTNLTFDKQDIGTIITSIGGTINNSSILRTGTFRPYLEYDYFADISPSSRQKISYISDAGSTYTLSNINSSTHNFKGKLGFDFITNTGWDFTSSYQRTQSKENGYSDALYFGANYISGRNFEYAMSLDNNNNVILDYKRNINGFDITAGSNYSLMNPIPDYGARFQVSSRF